MRDQRRDRSRVRKERDKIGWDHWEEERVEVRQGWDLIGFTGEGVELN